MLPSEEINNIIYLFSIKNFSRNIFFLIHDYENTLAIIMLINFYLFKYLDSINHKDYSHLPFLELIWFFYNNSEGFYNFK